MRSLKAWIVAAGLMRAASVGGEVKLPQIFGDGMVLQRGQNVPVWGTAAAGERVTVAFAGQKVETVADGKGQWKMKLAPLTANAEGRNFVVSSVYGEQSSLVCFTNVVVGEVGRDDAPDHTCAKCGGLFLRRDADEGTQGAVCDQGRHLVSGLLQRA